MKTTIDMAREAGFETMITKGKIHGLDRDGDYTEELKAFEAIVRADQQEIDAKVCETTAPSQINGYECAAAIRNRRNK
jgi:nicotinamidase-related amidase